MMKNYMNVKGRIFDIQRYSIHDGKGIRTIVFLKGCVLRCRWCCNPESQEYAIQTMLVPDIMPFGMPNGSGVLEADGKLRRKPKTVGEDVTVAEVMETVERDRPYYWRSGGGLTLSGGESLCQPEFAAALLRAAKERVINTAMESMGCAKFEVIKMLLPWLDHYLMDIKHMDAAKHKEFTGRSNELMLENARKIAAYSQEVASGAKPLGTMGPEQGGGFRARMELSIRVPVIPTFNDSEEEIRQIARFADSLPGVRRLCLLPYHRLGQDKYEGLGREYLMPDILPPTAEKMEQLKRAVEGSSRLACQIGG